MRRFGIAALVVTGCAFVCATAFAAPATRAVAAAHSPIVVADETSQQSLYKRLGGYDGIAALTDDLIVRLVTDKKLAKFFTGMNDTTKARIRQHFVDFLCNATGGPCIYLGQDMKTAHKGLNITEEEWNAGVADLTASFDKFNVGKQERADLVAKLTSVKADIVQGK